MGDGFGKLFLLFLAVVLIFLGASQKGSLIMAVLFSDLNATGTIPTTTPTTTGPSSGGSTWGTIPSSNPTNLLTNPKVT